MEAKKMSRKSMMEGNLMTNLQNMLEFFDSLTKKTKNKEKHKEKGLITFSAIKGKPPDKIPADC